MAEVEALPVVETAPRRFHFDWLLPILWKPRQIFRQILAENRSNWITPLLVLTVAALVLVAVQAPIRQALAQAVPVEPPQDFQWWSPEQQAQWQEAMTARSGNMFVYVLPILGELAKIWLGWLILSSLLHLVLTLLGSRTSNMTIQNLVAWASVPLILRYVVQIIFTWQSKALISAPGISGFAPTGEGFGFAWLAAILVGIDIYLIWQVVLILIGLRPLAGITLAKAIIGVVLTTLVVLALGALPTAILSLAGGLEMSRPFMF